jgi:ribonuclease HII
MRGAACTMRAEPDLALETRLWRSGLSYVAGLDEAGRGALAGPVAVGAVMLPKALAALRPLQTRHETQLAIPRSASARSMINPGTCAVRDLRGVRDSKQMTPLQRELVVPRIQQTALAWGVGFASAQEIDACGIVHAARLAALRALETLGIIPEYLLTDFRLELPELDVDQTALVRGDVCCLSIAAASVLAKTARDALMREMDMRVPGYGLAAHKGYGTLAHRRAVQRMGRSPIHRKTFAARS